MIFEMKINKKKKDYFLQRKKLRIVEQRTIPKVKLIEDLKVNSDYYIYREPHTALDELFLD